MAVADHGWLWKVILVSLLVPMPQYCRPLTGRLLGMRICCATEIDLSGSGFSKCTRGSDQPQDILAAHKLLVRQ